MASSISRRDVLRAGIAGAITPLARPVQALLGPPEGFSFGYFSDTHIGLNKNIAECRALLQEMQNAFQPVFAINGGDVTDYGWDGEYRNWTQLAQEMPFRIHCNPGNHDVRWSPLGMQVFRKHVGQNFRSFEHQGVLIAILDSTVPLSHWGHYETSQLKWLGRELERVGTDAPVVLATHHWVGRDAVMIDNEDDLMRLIRPYNVKLILTGHGHSDLLWTWDETPCTMNLGLYQGSYQRVTVDRKRRVLTLDRRSAKRPQLGQILEVPLAAKKAKRRAWTVGRNPIRQGELVQGDLSGATEARWNQGPYMPLAEQLAATTALVPGSNSLTVRESAEGRTERFQVNVRSESALRPLWQTKISGGVMSHLRLTGNLLIVSAMDGSLHALDKRSGKIVWRAATGEYCHSSPCIEGDRVVVGSADGAVYAFSLKDGKPLWKHKTGGPVYAGAAFAQGLFGMASGDGKVYGIDAKTGIPRWTYVMPTSNTNFAQSAASTDGERFFVGAWDNQLYAVNASNGELVWKQPCNPRTFAFSPAIGSPHAADGSVFVSANGNGLFRFDGATGEKRWEISSPGEKYGHSGPVMTGDRVVVGCLGDNGEVRCVQASDGKELWCCKTGAVIYDSSPSIADGLAAIGSVDAILNLIKVSDGSLAAQYRLPRGHFLSKPVSEPGRVYAANFSDSVSAFEVRA